MNEPREIYQIQMDVRFSARYHAMCERWYLILNDAVIFSGLLLSSAAVGGLVKNIEWLAITSAVTIALLHAINLTVGSVRKAIQHRDQYRRYQSLEAEIASNKFSAQDADAAYLKIETDDPPVVEAFRRLAYVENLRASGHDDETRVAEAKLTLRDRLIRATM